MSAKKKDTKKAGEYKAKGNDAYGKQKYKEAIDCYTKAISYDNTDATFFTNRSAAYAALENYAKALEDADASIRLNPTWSKGYWRKGTALQSMKRLDEAVLALQAGLKHESTNKDLLSKLEEVKAEIAKTHSSKEPAPSAPTGPLTPAQQAKEEGNVHYKESRYDDAIESYTKAINLAKDENEKAVYYSNRAACFAQKQMYTEVVTDCNLCLDIQTNNVKALIRRGLAFEARENLKMARLDMSKALSLEPSARQASEALVRIDRALKLQATCK